MERSNPNPNHSGDFHQNQQRQPCENDVGLLGYFMRSFPVQLMRYLLRDLCQYPTTMDDLKTSAYVTFMDLRESPCTAVLYLCMGLFGVIPALCFSLFVLGFFLMSVVWFIVGQVMAISVAAVIFGGIFFWLVLASSLVAVSVGSVVYFIFGWKKLSEYLTLHGRELTSRLIRKLDLDKDGHPD